MSTATNKSIPTWVRFSERLSTWYTGVANDLLNIQEGGYTPTNIRFDNFDGTYDRYYLSRFSIGIVADPNVEDQAGIVFLPICQFGQQINICVNTTQFHGIACELLIDIIGHSIADDHINMSLGVRRGPNDHIYSSGGQLGMILRVQ